MKDKLLYLYCDKQIDIYIPKYRKAKNITEVGVFVVSALGGQYKQPQPRIVKLRN